MASPPRELILGVQVSAIDIPTAVATMKGWIDAGHAEYVCENGVHGVMESGRNSALRDIHNAAGLVTPDGMPLVWISRWRGYRGTSRVYGPDLMLKLCERSLERGYLHFLYGGAKGVADLLAERLVHRFPGLKIVGTHCPRYRPLTAERTPRSSPGSEPHDRTSFWVGRSEVAFPADVRAARRF